MGLGFGSHSPYYAAIAEAGSDGWIVGKRVTHWNVLKETPTDTVRVARHEKRNCNVKFTRHAVS